ncbi:MAG: hypothetical protein ACIAXF_12830 [Phycisphaerales bacterium JB063]
MSESAITPTDPTALPVVTGVIASVGDGFIELKLPGTDYRPKLRVAADFAGQVGQKVSGVVRAQARRMDVVTAGGRFVEPVFGRPRRVQGMVSGGSVTDNAVYVTAGPRLCITPLPPQQASDFSLGEMVSFDVEPGASFERV